MENSLEGIYRRLDEMTKLLRYLVNQQEVAEHAQLKTNMIVKDIERELMLIGNKIDNKSPSITSLEVNSREPTYKFKDDIVQNFSSVASSGSSMKDEIEFKMREPYESSTPVELTDNDVEVFDRLRDSELETARLIAKGMNNRDIGKALDVTATAVCARLARMTMKLRTDSRRELATKLRLLFERAGLELDVPIKIKGRVHRGRKKSQAVAR